MAVQEFNDHFSSGSLDTDRWLAITSGAGSVNVSGSDAVLAKGGADVADCSAIVLKEALDFTKDWVFICTVRFTGTNSDFGQSVVALVSGDSLPAIAPAAEIAPTRRLWIDNQTPTILAQKRWQYRIRSNSGTLYNWRSQFRDWSTTFGYSHPKANDDNYITIVIRHSVTKGLRISGYGNDAESSSDTTTGFRLAGDSDWVAIGTNNGEVDEFANGYIVIGDFTNDNGNYDQTLYVERAAMYELQNNRREFAFAAGFATSSNYQIFEYVCPLTSIDEGVPFYLTNEPNPDDNVVVSRGADTYVQDPYALEHTDGTQYLLQNRTDGSSNGFIVIRSRSGLGQSWSSGTDIIDYNETGLDAAVVTCRFPQLLYVDSAWYLFFSVEESPYSASIYIAKNTNSDPTTAANWAILGEIITESGSGWRQNGVAQPFVFKYGNVWRMLVSGYNSGLGANGQWQGGMFEADSIEGTWTEVSGNPIWPIGGAQTQVNGSAVSSRVFNVDDSSSLVAGTAVVIGTQVSSANTQFRITRIRTAADNQVEVYHRISVADNLFINTITHASIAPRSIRKRTDGAGWEMWVTAFRFSSSQETVARLITSDPGDPAEATWSLDTGDAAIPLPLTSVTNYVGSSEENIGFIFTMDDLIISTGRKTNQIMGKMMSRR